jgi:flagellar basal-body rod modification protein FlgD
MSVTATSGTTSTTGQTTTTGEGKSVLGKDDFLNLMIAQMKYQDPLNPSDGTQYAAQLAQFSSLEQLTNLNTTMTSAESSNVSLVQSVNNTMSATLIGKQVKLDGGTINYNKEDSIELGYNLPANAASASISIVDSNGNVVKTINDIDKTSGDHKLSWDFTDNNGEKVTTGTYTFSVNATDGTGAALTTTVFKYGIIAGIKYDSSGAKLMIGDVDEIVNP